MDQEASLLPAASSHTVVRRKRALQLNETVYEEPEYVATKGGTYNVAEMPERFKSPNKRRRAGCVDDRHVRAWHDPVRRLLPRAPIEDCIRENAIQCL